MFIGTLLVLLGLGYMVHRGEVDEGSQPAFVWEEWLDNRRKDSV